jgi:hypothetical protein
VAAVFRNKSEINSRARTWPTAGKALPKPGAADPGSQPAHPVSKAETEVVKALYTGAPGTGSKPALSSPPPVSDSEAGPAWELRQKAGELYDLGVHHLGDSSGLVRLPSKPNVPDIDAVTRNIAHNSDLLARKYPGVAELQADAPPAAEPAAADVEKRIAALKRIPFSAGARLQFVARTGQAGTLPASSATGVGISDSTSVAIGNGGTVRISHQCRVRHPTIEMSQLLEGAEGWGAKAARGRTESAGALTSYSVRIAPDMPIDVQESRGVVVGDRASIAAEVRTTLRSCPLHAPKLLANRQIRELVERAREAHGDPATLKKIKGDLEKEIYAEARRLGPEALIENFHGHVRAAYGAKVGSVRGLLRVEHVNGIAVGTGNHLCITETTKIDEPTIRQ